ncbi:SEC-C domain-containing protein [Bacillus alkalicola]|uniref:SEC-C domain-containing protein n=2 Tax=Bacillales TaxID=1385 RepID=A0ABS6JX30_9BACI|nr:SEC-C domain-containing protein [Bacillus alkalicola]
MDIGRNDPCFCGSGKKYKKCCINLNKEEIQPSITIDAPFEEVDRDIEQGYTFFYKNEASQACDYWVAAWMKCLEWIAVSDIKDIQEADRLIDDRMTGHHLLFNWVQDFDMALERAGHKDERYIQVRIDFAKQFRHHFPESNSNLLFNMGTAAAEGLFLIGEVTKGERLFEQITKEYDNPWGYIRWGDMYNSLIFPKLANVDKEKAVQLYEKARAMSEDQDALEGVKERMEDLV